MEPISASERNLLREKGLLQERIDFARQIENYRVDPLLLHRALYRTAKRYFESKGIAGMEFEALFPRLALPPGRVGMPTEGSIKVFALLIEFLDFPHTVAVETMNDGLFGSSLTNLPYESMADYYRRASYNKLDIGGATLGWYQVNQNRSSIATTAAGRDALIKEALQHFDDLGHDFKQYDNDGDGVIDYFLVFWTGPDTTWGTFWWGYQPTFTDNKFLLDGMKLGKYSWQWESRPVGAGFNPVVAIHETGHALGLPDLYDYDEKFGPYGGVGGADMMDRNRYDLNCFSKWLVDWLTPTAIYSGCRNMIFDPSGTSQDCVVVWPSLGNWQIFSEFFMIQNRQLVGNDLIMPGGGLMIWHIDATLDETGQDFAYDNSYTAHKLVRLMEADGLEEIEKDQDFNIGDLYTPGDSFGPSTVPSNATYDGSINEIEVTNIIANGNRISADIYATRGSPNINVSTTRIDFGKVKRGAVVKKSLKIENLGKTTLNCTISLVGYFGPSFSIDGSLTPSILPGASCSYLVEFHATTLGPHRAGIRIYSNDPDTPRVNVSLVGFVGNGDIR